MQLSIEQRKQLIRDKYEKFNPNPVITGGQSCGVITSSVGLKSDALGISIMVSLNPSQLKNLNLAQKLMDIALDDWGYFFERFLIHSFKISSHSALHMGASTGNPMHPQP